MGRQDMFSIGIPTYNRVGLLREALESASSQTYAPIQIVVSDNASTDGTRDVVRSFPGIKYHRHRDNLGPEINFVTALQLADGEYFSWLQDDDLVFRDFARRAAAALDAHPKATAYLAYAMMGPSACSVHFPALYGPPFALDWPRGTLREIDGALVIPFSLLLSVAIPPVVAFRTQAAREAVERLGGVSNYLFWERLFLAEVVRGRTVVAEPYVAGLFRQHGGQGHLGPMRDRSIHVRQWTGMVHRLGALVGEAGSGVVTAFRDALNECHEVHIRTWSSQALSWPDTHWLARDVRLCLEEAASAVSTPPRRGWHVSAKDCLRQTVPPFLWRAGSSSVRYLKTLRE